MSKVTVEKAIEEILDIERESIRKRKQIVSANTVKYGKNKADVDAVNNILEKLDEWGICDED